MIHINDYKTSNNDYKILEVQMRVEQRRWMMHWWKCSKCSKLDKNSLFRVIQMKCKQYAFKHKNCYSVKRNMKEH